MRRLLPSFLAAVVLLGAFLLVLGPARLARQLAGANLGVFALGLVAVLAALVCWGEASRRLFVAADASLPRRRALAAYGAGAFGKQVLPMGNAGGPAVMAYAFDREVDVGYSRSLAVIVVAEFLSLAASVVLAFVGVAALVLFTPSGPLLRWLGVGVALVAVALGTLGVAVWYRRRYVGLATGRFARLLAPIAGRLSPALGERLRPENVDATLARYYETFDAVAGDRRAVLSAFALTQLGWFCYAVPLYTGARALGVDLPLVLAMVLVPAAGLATVFPLPGGLGGLEVALAGLLAALAGIDLGSAGAVVVLFRLCSFWFFVLVCGATASMAAIRVRELPVSLEPTVAPVRSNGGRVDYPDETAGDR